MEVQGDGGATSALARAKGTPSVDTDHTRVRVGQGGHNEALESVLDRATAQRSAVRRKTAKGRQLRIMISSNDGTGGQRAADG